MATHENTNGRVIVRRSAGNATHIATERDRARFEAEQGHADLARRLDELAAATAEMHEAQKLADLAAENRERAIANYHAAHRAYEQSFAALQDLLILKHKGGSR